MPDEQPNKGIPRVCEQCGITFYVRCPALAKDGRGRFCGMRCVGLSQRKTLAEKLWSRVEKTDRCWIWIGVKDPSGYGDMVASGGGRRFKAHRVSWELAFGPIPPGLKVCHHCDNRACVRPDHLFLGTQLDNMRDCVSKGRQARGERLPQSKITSEIAAEMFALRALGVRQSEIARRFKVTDGAIHYLLRR